MNISIKQISTLFKKELQTCYHTPELNQLVFMSLMHVLNMEKSALLAYPDKLISQPQYQQIKQHINRLKKHEPIQYILGFAEFYDLTFKVSPAVLIPRPETEELVHWIIQENKQQAPRILDIGTGSGCIPITLKNNLPQAIVFACDISEDALKLATKNAIKHACQITFFTSDILITQARQLPQNLDILVSNPPYVKNSEKQAMTSNVLKFEPHLALFVNNDKPLIFYDKIAELGKTCLKLGGHIYFEINENLGPETCDLLIKKGYKNVIIKKDLYGKSRMIKAQK